MGVPPTHFSLRSGRSLRIFSVLQAKRRQLELKGCGISPGKSGEDLQRRGHVAWGDAVDSDAGIGPLDSQRGGEVLDRRLGRIVGPAT